MLPATPDRPTMITRGALAPFSYRTGPYSSWSTLKCIVRGGFISAALSNRYNLGIGDVPMSRAVDVDGLMVPR